MKFTDVEPCGTVTLAGTLSAAAFELDRATVTPPLPAAAVRVTVPFVELALLSTEEASDTLLSAAVGGLTVTPNVLFTPEWEAVNITELVELTAPP